ncbi:hypothetical protein KP509_23G016300 [Ceratopteris richardii]|uniref:Probable zinc-ribbon domain-containing protein n=1 Tax=Ceratopteris richardii TaxID=49495 RepID=A0A8T2RY04_CERRI|nr:hypothetical protein KP509_23G016300 [Ceratopteris richardii]
MPADAIPKTGRKKVRCPKCTALFAEPAKPVFECPICSCRLSANGAVELEVRIGNSPEDRDYGQKGTDALENIAQRSSDTNSRDSVDTQQQPSQIHNGEKGLLSQSEGLPAVHPNIDKEGKRSVVDDAENISVNDEVGIKKNSYQACSSDFIKETEEEDFLGKGKLDNKRLQLQALQTTRCEFSFKYSLQGTSPLESESSKRRLPSSNLASDVSLHAPLRVRIVNAREESSDQSEHGRYSSSSDMQSHDGSESEFDFPAPWADGPQDRGLPDSHGQVELYQVHAKHVSDGPHQLELIEIDEGTPNEDRDSAYMQMGEKSKEDDETIKSDHYSHVTSSITLVDPSIVYDEHGLGKDGSAQVVDPDKKEELAAFSIGANEGSLEWSHVGRKMSNMVIHDGQVFPEIIQSPLADVNVNERNLATKNMDFLPSLNHNHHASSSHVNVSTQQDLSTASSSHSIPHSHKVQNDSEPDQCRSDFKGHVVKNASDLEMPSFINKDVQSFRNHIADASVLRRDSNAYVGSDAMDKGISDGEREVDLYNHHEVHEWQYNKEKPTLPKVDHNSSAQTHSSNHMNSQESSGQTNFFSDYASNNMPLPNSQPFFFNNHCVSDHLSFGSPSSSHVCGCLVPPQHLMVPAGFQNHAIAPIGYHAVANGCMVFPHHHHPLMQAHFISPCALCLNHSGSLASNSGHADHWNYHQGRHSTFANSHTEMPTETFKRYDLPSSSMRFQGSPSNKTSQYPPVPGHGAVPYFICHGCCRLLEVPSYLLQNDELIQKLRCSACHKVTKFSNKLHPKYWQSSYNMRSAQQVPNGSNQVLPQVDANILMGSRVSKVSPHRGDDIQEKPRDAYIHTDSSYPECATSIITAVSQKGKIPELTEPVRSERAQDTDASLHMGVDEQDEGLAFGAPRISDGDSWDHVESRNQSPENIRSQAAGHVFDREYNGLIPKDQDKRPGSPLILLLNQESIKFRLNLDSDATPLSASSSPASDLPLSDNGTPSRSSRKKLSNMQMSRGTKYIAGLLRRSLKDASKGGH